MGSFFPLQLFLFVGGVSSFQQMSTSEKRAPFLWCWASLGPVAMKRKSFSFFLNQLSSFGYYDDCDISDSKEKREIAAVLDHLVAWPLQNAFTRKQQIQASIRAQYSHLLDIPNDVKTCHSDLSLFHEVKKATQTETKTFGKKMSKLCQKYHKITYIT